MRTSGVARSAPLLLSVRGGMGSMQAVVSRYNCALQVSYKTEVNKKSATVLREPRILCCKLLPWPSSETAWHLPWRSVFSQSPSLKRAGGLPAVRLPGVSCKTVPEAWGAHHCRVGRTVGRVGKSGRSDRICTGSAHEGCRRESGGPGTEETRPTR